jgi:hypothetical protein
MDPAAAENLSNYKVFQITKPNELVQRLLYQDTGPQAHIVPLKDATYVAENRSVVLHFAGPRADKGAFRVGMTNPKSTLVRSGAASGPTLHDTEGHPLTGPPGPGGRFSRSPIMARPEHRIDLDNLTPDGRRRA